MPSVPSVPTSHLAAQPKAGWTRRQVEPKARVMQELVLWGSKCSTAARWNFGAAGKYQVRTDHVLTVLAFVHVDDTVSSYVSPFARSSLAFSIGT